MASGDVKDLTIKVLQKIHAELTGLRVEAAETNKRLDRMQAELVHIRRDAMKRDTAALANDKRLSTLEHRVERLERRG
ncbi:MAG: hypothetical protein HY904_11140 [Deltaproteobacteria bacterium]|nr:hypothetical protein [Deltaproteobacteria bacterium]